MPRQSVDTDHLLADKTITLEPDYYDKFRISVENIPIELPDKEVKEFLYFILQDLNNLGEIEIDLEGV